MDALWRKQNIRTRSISAENPTGEPGKGAMAETGYTSNHSRELGKGWKVNPFMNIPAKTEVTLAHIKGSGMIRHIWMVPLNTGDVRNFILRCYWDGCDQPAVEVPIGDFFVATNEKYHQITSLLVCRNPYNGLNCYFKMPFRNECRITMENLNGDDRGLAFQIDYEERDIPEDAMYFHAQFFRLNPCPPKKYYPILSKITGKGCYIGTYMLYGITNNGWWGEGEIMFYMDGDTEYPTICGTGTEDYFCASYNFTGDNAPTYEDYSTPYAGFHCWKQNDVYDAVKRFSMYRWHVEDPIYFEKDLRIDIQLLGWRSGKRYLPLQSSDVSSVSYFYLDKPSCERRPLPDADGLEII